MFKAKCKALYEKRKRTGLPGRTTLLKIECTFKLKSYQDKSEKNNMGVVFPKTAEKVRARVERTGFVGRAALFHGKRESILNAEGMPNRRVIIRECGYVAGTAVHINLNLKDLTQITLFDRNKNVGASSRLEIVPPKTTLHMSPTDADLQKDLRDMINTLKFLGAKKNDLYGFCLFGITAEIPANVPAALHLLNSAGIPVLGAFAVLSPYHFYHTFLNEGIVKVVTPEEMRAKPVFQVNPQDPDLADHMSDHLGSAMDYHQELCGNNGRREFLECLLPRIAALHFNHPKTFNTTIRRAIRKGSEKFSNEIGTFFKEYERPPL